MSIPFYEFPSSPILIIGALGIAVAIAVFFVSYQKYFNSPLNKELGEKKKALIKQQKVLNERLKNWKRSKIFKKITLIAISNNLEFKTLFFLTGIMVYKELWIKIILLS